MKKTDKNYIIAIDGGAGVGKSTVSKEIAKKLNILYIDTGAMYRAVALYFLNNNIEICDENENIINSELKNIHIILEQNNNVLKVLLNNEDVTSKIRENRVSMATSKISIYKSVRKLLDDQQREMAKNNNVILEGRDIGTTVFPNANLKIFLTASVEEKTRRRLIDLTKKGENFTFEEIKKEIEKRDINDSTRKESPLVKAVDAIEIDTTTKTIEELVNEIVDLIHSKI